MPTIKLSNKKRGRESEVPLVPRERQKTLFSLLPDGIRKLRTKSMGAEFDESVSKEGIKSALKELYLRKHSRDTTEKQRAEAAYLHTYMTNYLRLLRDKGGGALYDAVPLESHSRIPVFTRRYRYDGKRGGGRRYTTLDGIRTAQRKGSSVKYPRSYGMQGCPRALRARLVGAFCRDVDMKNAHPVILLQLARKVGMDVESEMPRFSHYVSNRDTPGGWVDTLSDFHCIVEEFEGKRKDSIKELFCRLLYGGSYHKWIVDVLGRGWNEPKHPWVVELVDELKRLRTLVLDCDDWAAFAQAERGYYEKSNPHDSWGAERHAFALIAQTIENHLLEVVIMRMQERGWTITTLIYDGMHVKDRPELPDTRLQEDLDHVSRELEQHTGYAVELLEKPLFGLHSEPIELRRI